MATDWITSQITKKGRCIACLRDFEVGDDVLVPVNDDVAWINSTYCPKWVGHLDSANAYEEYLRDVKGITDFSIIKNMVFKWELHRIRKGYKSDIQIRELTKEHKADYLKMLEWQEKKQQRNLDRLRKAYERERQDILKDFEKIVEQKEDLQ